MPLALRWPCAGAGALLPPPPLLGALGATRAYGNSKDWAPRHSKKSRAAKQKWHSAKNWIAGKVKFKLKSHQGARKRFKQGADGKFFHWPVGRRHNLAKKSSWLRLKKRKPITPPERKKQRTLARMMPYKKYNRKLKGR